MLCIAMHSATTTAESAAAASFAGLSPWANRLVSAIVFTASFGLLLVAAWLQPDTAGHGTHTQLGLPPCGFYAATQLPCASCGMTTAFSYTADGNLLAAFMTQPAGAVMAIATAMLAVVSCYTLVTGISLVPLGKMIWRPRWAIALGVLLLASWAYTIAIAMGSIN